VQSQNISVKKTAADHTHKEHHPTVLHTENSNSKLKILWLIPAYSGLSPSGSKTQHSKLLKQNIYEGYTVKSMNTPTKIS